MEFDKLKVTINTFVERDAAAFKSLNEEWIKTYFELEQDDFEVLNHPKVEIIDQGGQIFTAKVEKVVVGVVALIKSNNKDYDFEIAKMAVKPAFQGHHIGEKLLVEALNYSQNLGANRIYLVTNSQLKPAIGLYKKLGFKEISHEKSNYKRGD